MPMSSTYFLFQAVFSLAIMAFYGYLAWVVARSLSRMADASEEIASDLKALREAAGKGKSFDVGNGVFGPKQ
ncbi:hypothetical protein Ocepr_2354 (plasmid) [Oceanithermus profundus DSM 14977]|uniref:Uncharacterized protein n=1 Tax=Oceanithermus profundus (strain DSM 14977 / NBRC 100410 / VKM B-2274 / 506) TaxID=670487 RepID=E4UAM3_OCEP5|nr:hypothetical protein [Oceanithermus profundus]ADR37802.1 hypothetical protein Ocepr_2354 [Oceanithermus profundus DSM 14977]